MTNSPMQIRNTKEYVLRIMGEKVHYQMFTNHVYHHMFLAAIVTLRSQLVVGNFAGNTHAHMNLTSLGEMPCIVKCIYTR